MTGNQLVAYNLKRARVERGWTQPQAAERLEPYLDRRWSVASFSVAERSAFEGCRGREFTADELLAFVAAFEVPLTYFLTPPVGVVAVNIGRAVRSADAVSEALLPSPSEQARLVERVRVRIGDLHALLQEAPGA